MHALNMRKHLLWLITLKLKRIAYLAHILTKLPRRFCKLDGEVKSTVFLSLSSTSVHSRRENCWVNLYPMQQLSSSANLAVNIRDLLKVSEMTHEMTDWTQLSRLTLATSPSYINVDSLVNFQHRSAKR